jgi:hypothetical protein
MEYKSNFPSVGFQSGKLIGIMVYLGCKQANAYTISRFPIYRQLYEIIFFMTIKLKKKLI